MLHISFSSPFVTAHTLVFIKHFHLTFQVNFRKMRQMWFIFVKFRRTCCKRFAVISPTRYATRIVWARSLNSQSIRTFVWNCWWRRIFWIVDISTDIPPSATRGRQPSSCPPARRSWDLTNTCFSPRYLIFFVISPLVLASHSTVLRFHPTLLYPVKQITTDPPTIRY